MIFTDQEDSAPPVKKSSSRRPAGEAVVISNAKTHLWLDRGKYWTSIPRKELETVIAYVELLEAQIEALIQTGSAKSSRTDRDSTINEIVNQ